MIVHSEVKMRIFDPIKAAKRPRIGLYAVGHAHYWEQFDGLARSICWVTVGSSSSGSRRGATWKRWHD